MENLEIEWSCYLRGGRRVLWNMLKTFDKTWCSSICLDTFSKAPHWGTESFAAHFNLTFIIFMSPHLTLSASQSLLSLTVTSTLRLTMGSSGHGPALLSPAPGRCRDIAIAGALSGLGREERSPASRDRPGPEELGTTRKHGFWRRCCWKYSDMNDEVIWLFQISLNDSVFLLIMGGATRLINTSAQNLFSNVL